MRVSFTATEFQSFSVAVEVRAIMRLKSGKAVAEVPPAVRGETEDDILEASVDGYLRWLRMQLAVGRRFEPATPVKRHRRGMLKDTPR